jgi:hypothetical protein
MRVAKLSALCSAALALVLSLPAWATQTAVPGTLNYVEGNAAMEAQSLDSNSIGSARLQPGQSLTTQNGKAEILLTPGVFLRVGDNSSVNLISPDLTNTRVAVNKGEAMVEVDQLYPENDLQVLEDGVNTRLEKTGLYAFDADQNQIRVFEGQALAREGDHQIKIKGGHELAMNTNRPYKAQSFDKKQYEQSDLYRWSSLRSSYLAEANEGAARTYIVNGWYGPGWIGAGWYWNPWYSAFTFIPGGGFLYSPFGWGFYSPLWAYRAPLFYGAGFFHHFGAGYHPAYAVRGHFAPRSPAASFRGGVSGGFRGGMAQRPAFAMSGPRSFGGFGGRR